MLLAVLLLEEVEILVVGKTMNNWEPWFQVPQRHFPRGIHWQVGLACFSYSLAFLMPQISPLFFGCEIHDIKYRIQWINGFIMGIRAQQETLSLSLRLSDFFW